MKIDKIRIVRGKKINVGNYETENYELSMEAFVEEKDEPHEVINGIKNILDQKLKNWEASIKGTTPLEISQNQNIKLPNKTEITTADQLINEIDEDPSNFNTSKETEEIETIISSNESSEFNTSKETEEIETQIGTDELTFSCPICKGIMRKKEGKDYYLCDKHWGYPDMIERGEVREKKF